MCRASKDQKVQPRSPAAFGLKVSRGWVVRHGGGMCGRIM